MIFEGRLVYSIRGFLLKKFISRGSRYVNGEDLFLCLLMIFWLDKIIWEEFFIKYFNLL